MFMMPFFGVHLGHTVCKFLSKDIWNCDHHVKFFPPHPLGTILPRDGGNRGGDNNSETELCIEQDSLS